MDYQKGESSLSKKSEEKDKCELVGAKLHTVSLRDIPLEVRRREAKKPMFLVRYE